ncbi:MAG: hypothetical protein ACREFZ_04650 [Acetobacteraceae bacterium]
MINRLFVLALALIAGLVPAAAPVAVRAATASAGPATGAGTAASTASVLQYHADAGRTGAYVVPGLTTAGAQRMHRDRRFHPAIAGPVYAQPLYWAPGHPTDAFVGTPTPGGRPMLLVATEQDVVYALDARTGAVIWKRVLGAPAPRDSLPCGNIDPTGITGAPAIDASRRVLYLDAMVKPPGGASPQHEIFALGLKNGSVAGGWPVDVAKAIAVMGKKFVAPDQGERGALTVVGGKVFVPYAGHFGDCAFYHGWVVGVDEASPTHVSAWSTRGRGGGIWGQGGVVSDGRALFVATGNTMGARTWADGEAVIRLGLALSFTGKSQDFFSPKNWRQLDARDLDLGGTSPVLVELPGGVGSGFILQLGKDGNAYLLRRSNLGGLGGALAVKHVSSIPIRTAPAVYTSNGATYVAFQGLGVDCPGGHSGDLVALRVSATPPRLAVAWCADEHGEGAPIVTTTNGTRDPIVWAAGAEGDNRLRGFRGSDGAVLFDGGGAAGAMRGLHRYQTLIAAGGRLYVAGDSTVYAFDFK